MNLGIIGLPNSTKTTIFNALTGSSRPVGKQVTGKMEVFTAVVDVPDPRVDQLAAVFRPRKVTRAKVSYLDIAGMGKGVGRSGLSGPFRNQIADVDGFVQVVRAFADETVPHPEGTVDPPRDVAIIDSEFLLADMVAVENRLERLASELQRAAGRDRQKADQEVAFLQRLLRAMEAGSPIRDLALTAAELRSLSGYSFLTLKPMLVLINTGDEDVPPAAILSYPHTRSAVATIKGQLEMEIAQMSGPDQKGFLQGYQIAEPGLDRIIRLSYSLVGLLSFFTVGEDEVRAWTIRQGATAVEAAAAIHSDLAHGFIRAEVVSCQDLLRHGGLTGARSAGTMRLEGREYVVRDGDIVHIRFNV